MPTTVETTQGSRNRWILPVVLAVLILLIVLGAIFGKNIRDMAAGSTATPTATVANSTPLVVTATPGAGATAAAGAAPSATASGGKGVSTPLPHATPVPTVPGLHLGMITRAQHIVDEIQRGANRGDANYTFYLNPAQVVQKNLPQYGFTQGFTVVSPNPSGPTPTPFVGADNRNIVKFKVQYQGKSYEVSLAQPVQQGPKGIWVIVTILAV